MEFRAWSVAEKKMLAWKDFLYLPWEVFTESPNKSAYKMMRYTGKKDMAGNKVFEGDLIESQVNGQKMEIRYGTYQAYCPVDKCCMDTVGFYAAAEGYPEMPIGSLEEYALVTGNIYENTNVEE